MAAEQPPDWVVAAIMMQESSSYYKEDGTIKYVDRRRGKAGERGPWQMTYKAFLDVKHSGETFAALSSSPSYAEELTFRRLIWLNKHWGGGDWRYVVEMWNAGPKRRSPAYLAEVLAKAKQLGY